MAKAVFGIANSREQADRIVARLQQEGFQKDNISVLFNDRQGDFVKQEGSTLDAKEQANLDHNPDNYRDYNQDSNKKDLGHVNSTKAPEGGVVGATAGGLIGGSLGLLAGIGALAIPGLGAFVAAGPIVAALSGLGVGGALGMLTGALVGMGIPEYEAKKYESHLNKGGTLISISTDTSANTNRAKEILKQEGAHDISSSQETR